MIGARSECLYGQVVIVDGIRIGAVARDNNRAIVAIDDRSQGSRHEIELAERDTDNGICISEVGFDIVGKQISGRVDAWSRVAITPCLRRQNLIGNRSRSIVPACDSDGDLSCCSKSSSIANRVAEDIINHI